MPNNHPFIQLDLDDLGVIHIPLIFKANATRMVLRMMRGSDQIQLTMPKHDFYIYGEAEIYKRAKQFIEKNKGWLKKNITTARHHIKTHAIKPNATLLLNGTPHILRHYEGKGATKFSMADGEIHITCPYDRMNYRLMRELKAYAKDRLTIKTQKLAKQIYDGEVNVKIKDQKGRWGSCSSKGNINYNWRIIMAPESVQDYLIAHEVSHLKHPHHRQSFWRQVEKLDPNYQTARQWLRNHGEALFYAG